MRFKFLLALLFISACQNQYKPEPTPYELIAQQCAATYQAKELEECIAAANKAYEKEEAKRRKEEQAEIERRNKESLRQQKEEKMRQLAADGQKCKDYGFKKGTKDFASCMMQIEQARVQEARAQEALATQQAIANQQMAIAQQQMEENRRAQRAQNFQNYLLQQQAIQAQQNIASQNAIANMNRNRINCSSYRTGNYVNTNCY